MPTMHILPVNEEPPPVIVFLSLESVGAPREMPPKKAKTVRIKEPEVSEDEEDDQKEAAALKKESGAQIVRNLLEKKRISTPHPNTPFVKWAEWTCLHCDETYYPAQN